MADLEASAFLRLHQFFHASTSCFLSDVFVIPKDANERVVKDLTSLIRADADSLIGGGHIMRCLALAKKLSASGWRCAFAVNPEAKLVVRELEHSGFELVVLAENATAEHLEKRFPEGVELLLVDHYGCLLYTSDAADE